MQEWKLFVENVEHESQGIREVASSLAQEFQKEIRLAKGMIRDEFEEKAREHFSQYSGSKMKFRTGGSAATVEGTFTGNIKFEVQNNISDPWSSLEQVIFEIERGGYKNWVRAQELK
ncbi:MAG TPA: hypothetical protein VMW36_06440 [Patescibacteria group bacterium]|nr:hypothetical protein [Patescibacteria group bacterium]